jgi:thiamine-monophosphate kinase
MSVGEFDWINELAARFGAGEFGDGVHGIGDDAAIIPATATGLEGRPTSWVVSVDSQVGGVHFQPAWLSWAELGRRLMHIGFSDVAAMGAAPAFALVSVEVGAAVTAQDRRAFAEGIAAANDELGVRLIGGNVSGRQEGFSAHVTAIGVSARRTMLLRSGACPGDAVYVTGPLGAAAAGIGVLRGQGAGDSAIDVELVDAYRHPRAHWREGMALAESGWVRAAIDVSDGLAADLGHLCDAGGVGAALESEAIPMSEALITWCRQMGRDPLDRALGGGEDYVLLFAAPPDSEREEEIGTLFKSFGGGLWRIGMITATGRLEICRRGVWEPLPARGFDHLAGQP